MKFANLFLYILLCLFLVSCSDGGKRLADIESYIEDSPDSALVELRSMPDPCSRSLKAKHALLHSMALDKCWVDLQTDSIIAPAVSWYSRLGRPDDRLKMYYYRARIAQNAGDEETAMQWLVKGERFVRRSRDNAALGRYYSFKSELYFNSYQNIAALRDEQIAYGYHSKSTNTKGTIISLLNLADIYYCDSEFDKVSSLLDTLIRRYGSLSGSRQERYYALRLNICSALGTDPKPILDSIRFNIRRIDDYPLLEMSNASVCSGQIDSAKRYVALYEEIFGEQGRDSKYFLEKSRIYSIDGDFENAYKLNERYIRFHLKNYFTVLNEETRSIEERHAFEQAIFKTRTTAIACVCLVIILLLALLQAAVDIKRHVKTNAILIKRYHSLEEEKLELESMLSSSAIDDESRALLHERIARIELVMVRRAKKGHKDDVAFLDELIGGKQNLISELTLLFSINHQPFINELSSSGLTPTEIGYCCLYAMGLNGKDINNIFNSTTPYHASTSIRSKLGLGPTNTNLSLHIKNLFTASCKKL